MAWDGVKCFGCGEYGHIERECPRKNSAAELGDSDKPPHCGKCDRRTRLVTVRRDGRDVVVRCRCHPSGQQMAVQFKRCGECKAVVYEWDMNSPCGSHLPVSEPREYIPEKEKAK